MTKTKVSRKELEGEVTLLKSELEAHRNLLGDQERELEGAYQERNAAERALEQAVSDGSEYRQAAVAAENDFKRMLADYDQLYGDFMNLNDDLTVTKMTLEASQKLIQVHEFQADRTDHSRTVDDAWGDRWSEDDRRAHVGTLGDFFGSFTEDEKAQAW